MRSLIDSNDINSKRKEFEDKGVILIPNAFDLDFCEKTKSFIDSWSGDKDLLYNGTETRIWDAQKKDVSLNMFFEICHQTTRALFQKKPDPYTLLAIQNLSLKKEDVNSQMGRWHLDSFCKQVKIFLFLTDTSEESGPFEFIPGSHNPSFKFKNLLSGKYFSLSDIFNKTRAYQSLNEGWIEKLSKNGMPSQPVICKAGTAMIVNTSAIHRARPCKQGPRYALTAYYQ